MKSLTIHNIDAELAQAIEERARATGRSRSKVVKKLLRQALNLSDEGKPRRNVSAFFGAWTKEEAEEFNQATKIFGQIDEERWR